MSNVCLPLAIKSLCRVRPSQCLPARQLFCGFHKLRSTTTSTVFAESRQIHQCIARDVSKRSLAHKSHTKPVSTPRSRSYTALPESRLENSKTQASHTEGILDSESWRDYDPEGGLPLPGGELNQAAIDQVFGVDGNGVDNGNYIICVMNWRRMSGALIDVGIKFPSDSGVSTRQALQALEYLRQTYPAIDEEKLGARWADEESQKLRQQLQDRAVQLGLYKADTTQQEEEIEEEEEDEASKQGTAYGRARTGTSMLERLRASNIEKREVEESAAEIRIAQKERSLLSAARGPLELGGGLQQQVGVKRYGTMDVVLQQPASSASLAQSEPPPWVKYYQDQAEIIKENIVPQMSALRRLAPSALVFLLVTSGCYYLGTHYTPPPVEARLFPGVPPSVATLGTITAVMVGMFAVGKIPPFWRTLNKYFALVPAYPYALSNLGAILRHDKFTHLLNNTIILWAVGLTLHEDVGRGWFLATFIGAGVTGTMGALTYHVLARNWSTYIFGASGAMYGILSALCVLRPQGTVYVFGYEVPFAAWVVLVLVGASQLRGVFRGARFKDFDNTDYLGHAFGLLSGIVTGMGLRSRFKNDSYIAQRDVRAITAAE